MLERIPLGSSWSLLRSGIRNILSLVSEASLSETTCDGSGISSAKTGIAMGFLHEFHGIKIGMSVG